MTPMQQGRLNKELSKLYRIDGNVISLGDWLKSRSAIVKDVRNGDMLWNRRAFNRMDYAQQAAYEANLKAKRLYFINNMLVPKIVHDNA